MAEVDRILRPEGKLIVRDNNEVIGEIESMAKSMKWEIRMVFSKDNEGLLFVRKTMWRPTETELIKYAIIWTRCSNFVLELRLECRFIIGLSWDLYLS